MKVDCTALVLDLDEKPIPNGKKGEEELKLTVGDVITTALLSGAPDEQNVAAKDKLDRFELAYRVRKAQKAGESVELEFDDVKVIRELVGKCWAALVVGRVFKHLQLTGE